MARPVKNGLDYFPLDTVIDEKVELIEAEYGIKGFGIIVRLFQRIFGKQGYYIELTDEVGLLFSKQVGEGWGFVSELIQASIRRGIFNKEMYDRYSILTSSEIQETYLEACKRRKNVVLEKRYLLISVTSNYNNVVINHDNVNNNSKKDNNNTQSKVKESKVKESKAETADSAIAKILHTFEHCGFKITGRSNDEIKVIAQTYPEEWVIEAIKRAADRDKRTIAYMKGILRSWQAAGGIDEVNPSKKSDMAHGRYTPEPNVPKKYIPPEPTNAEAMPEEFRSKWGIGNGKDEK